jgi:aminoglycoside 6'-N-acetyltransferase
MADELNFRALKRVDFPLLQRWLAEPHVAAWWHEQLDLASIEKKYEPRIDGREPTHVFTIEQGGRSIGFIQWYRWRDYPEHAAKLGAEPESAGIDFAIGETDSLGKGLGARLIAEFLQRVVFVEPGITAVYSDPEEKNVRSLRAFARAGFEVTKRGYFDGKKYRQCVVRRKRGRERTCASR